ncbi:MAG: 2-phosphosulfolactate phosphatase [Thermoleophilaceae bacterium]
MAPLIEVAFTPAEAQRAEVAVVVDVLRAGSTIVAALEGGFRRVLCCETVERAESLRAPGRLLAGERGCRRIPGFDHGNSPAGLGQGGGAELVLCTTNGTPAIMAATGSADEVLVGSLLNLDAIIAALPPSSDVTVVCAGTDGRFALEDAYVAGRIVARLSGKRTDAARAAERLASAYAGPLEPLGESADARVLRETGQAADIELCARESLASAVPRVSATSPGVATMVSEQAEAGPLSARMT